MKQITNDMAINYKLYKNGFDFLGYTFNNKESLSYHHMIIPKRCGGPETIENGAILVRETAHDYLHLIEVKDQDIFDLITSEMIDENIKRTIDIYNLKRIRELLLYFEDRHKRDENKKGQKIIKREYIERRIQL